MKLFPSTLNSLGAGRKPLSEELTRGRWKPEPAEAEISLKLEWKMRGRGSKDVKYLQSKSKQLTAAKDESFERHEKGINQYIQNIVTSLWVRMSSQNVMLLKLIGKRKVSALLEKSVIIQPAIQNEGETNLDINVGRQRQAGSRKADPSFINLNRTICGRDQPGKRCSKINPKSKGNEG